MHPLAKNHFSKCLKILKKKFSVHLDILYSLAKFCKKKIIFVTCVKRQFFMLQNCYLRSCFLSFLHKAQKMSFHTKTLVDGHRMFRYIQGFFCSNYLNF
jgi:hypothetical protein